MTLDQDDEYEVPLRDQRFFGAGIKRKRIQFVASTSETLAASSLPTTPSASAADRYLSIVLKQPSQAERSASEPAIAACEDGKTPTVSDAGPLPAEQMATCEICHRPLSTTDFAAVPHESSIVHQICLQHSHPPSHIDRTRKGLAVLAEQGWDPDNRLGLGAEGEGRLHPVKATENPNRAGLGASFQKVKAVERPVKLDARKIRLMEKEGKKKAERSRNAFYRSEDVDKYLRQE